MKAVFGTQVQAYVEPSSHGWAQAVDKRETPTTNVIPTSYELKSELTRFYLSGVTVAALGITTTRWLVASNQFATGLSVEPSQLLTQAEIEDVLASRKERKRGESRRFSDAKDLLADLDSWRGGHP